MRDIEFQDYVNRLIENSIMSCNDQMKEQDIEKCRRCLKNIGFSENGKLICMEKLEN